MNETPLFLARKLDYNAFGPYDHSQQIKDLDTWTRFFATTSGCQVPIGPLR